MATLLLPIAVGNGATGSDFTLTEPTLVTMVGAHAAVGAKILLQLKLSTGVYRTVDTLKGARLSGVLAAGVYRPARVGPHAIGLERA